MTPLHWSQLRSLMECPAQYQHDLEHPIVATTAMTFATLVHEALFGPGPYGSPAVFQGEHKRGKEWTEFKADNAGREWVTAKQVAEAELVARAVELDPVAGPLVKGGLAEQTINWNVGNRACEGTPDMVQDECLIDLKVTTFVNPARFPGQCRRMAWHGQAAWYCNGLGLTPDNCYRVSIPWRAKIIAVSPKPPYTPTVYSLTLDTIKAGTKLWRSLLEQLNVCEEADAWPGYAQQEVPLDLETELELEFEGEKITL